MKEPPRLLSLGLISSILLSIRNAEEASSSCHIEASPGFISASAAEYMIFIKNYKILPFIQSNSWKGNCVVFPGPWAMKR